MRHRSWAGFVTIAALLLCIPDVSDRAFPTHEKPDTAAHRLEAIRLAGDLSAQRQHVWQLLLRLTASAKSAGTAATAGEPLFDSWFGENAVFAPANVEEVSGRGIRGFSPRSASTSISAEVPLLSYTLYNDAAYRHIRLHRLYRQDSLEDFQQRGATDITVATDRSIPAFPRDAIILKTAWWPVAASTVTALPVWDPDDNPARSAGNDYLTWSRIVSIEPSDGDSTGHRSWASLDFAGRTYRDVHRVDLQRFYYITVDANLAQRLNLDDEAQKLFAIAIGRQIRGGDRLVLVGASLATKEIRDWVWGTFWWHDGRDVTPDTADRPGALRAPWSNYRMQVAFDDERPTAIDGAAHVAFNPWLEGRFPDGGHGNGTVSNCLACHRRASYPAVAFLPVSRGRPDLSSDPAYAAGRLRTNFVWSIALHALPRDPIP